MTFSIRPIEGKSAGLGFKAWEKKVARAYSKQIDTRFRRLKYTAKRRHIPVELSFNEYAELISKSCYFCNGPLEESGGGLDRLDNEKGYVTGNSVPCCGYCNAIKSDLTLDQLRFFLSSILNHWLGFSLATSGKDCSYYRVETETDRVEKLKNKFFWLVDKEKSKWFGNQVATKEEDFKRLTSSEYKYKRLRQMAREQDLECLLTLEEYKKVVENPCYYCGGVLCTVGYSLDRIDNEQGYTLANVRPCCKRCNMSKSNSTEDEFKDKILSIYHNWINPPTDITVQK